MADRYLRQKIKRNWKTIVIIILSLIILSIIIKNIGEVPYENRHLQTSTYPLKFNYNGKEVKGFVYAAYWVRTKNENIEHLSPNEFDNYLYEHGHIDLAKYKDEIISVLKSYSLEEIKEDWYDDVEYFKSRDVYFIDNDKRLTKALKKADIKLDLPYEFKKVFFVYLDQSNFAKFIKEKDKF